MEFQKDNKEGGVEVIFKDNGKEFLNWWNTLIYTLDKLNQFQMYSIKRNLPQVTSQWNHRAPTIKVKNSKTARRRLSLKECTSAVDFTTAAVELRRQDSKWYVQLLKEINCQQPRILYTVKMSFKNEDKIKTL